MSLIDAGTGMSEGPITNKWRYFSENQPTYLKVEVKRYF